MNKDEILAKSKVQGIDEREQSVILASFGFANIIVIILCLIFYVINMIRGESSNEFSTIIFASLAATEFHKYRQIKNKKIFLINVYYWGLVSILSFITFIVKG